MIMIQRATLVYITVIYLISLPISATDTSVKQINHFCLNNQTNMVKKYLENKIYRILAASNNEDWYFQPKGIVTWCESYSTACLLEPTIQKHKGQWIIKNYKYGVELLVYDEKHSLVIQMPIYFFVDKPKYHGLCIGLIKGQNVNKLTCQEHQKFYVPEIYLKKKLLP